MSHFIVNHSAMYIYRLTNWRQTYEEVLDENPEWSKHDDIEFYDIDDTTVVGIMLQQNYGTNMGVYELPVYMPDPNLLVWYMDTHGFGIYDISRAIKVYDGHQQEYAANVALNDLMNFKKKNSDIDTLCNTFNKVM